MENLNRLQIICVGVFMFTTAMGILLSMVSIQDKLCMNLEKNIKESSVIIDIG